MTQQERSLRALRKIRDHVESGNEEKALRLLGKEITRILRNKENITEIDRTGDKERDGILDTETEERFTKVE